jgi:pimeloyl-ACP methyl ester carboxylesterase
MRGVFVPSDEGAPVALLLLGSSASVTDLTTSGNGILWDLRDRGIASLCLDYRGVGPSGGRRSPRNLVADARTAFAEAARRAGGAERVFVRGVSIGTLAAASLMLAGERPGAIALAAPVRAETIARNYSDWRYADVVGLLLAPFLRKPVPVDILRALELAPALVMIGERDPLLGEEEKALVAGATERGGGRVVALEGAGHMAAAFAAYGVRPEEAELLRLQFPDAPRRSARIRAAEAVSPFPPGGAERVRLARQAAFLRVEPPELSAALALSPSLDPASTDVRLWLRVFSRTGAPRIPVEAWRRLLDLSDPDGPLDIRELPHLVGTVRWWEEPADSPDYPERLARRAEAEGLGRSATWRIPLEPELRGLFGDQAFEEAKAGGGKLPARAPARLRLPPDRSLRQAIRLVFRAAGVPDRLRDDGSLDVWSGGAWRPLRYAP